MEEARRKKHLLRKKKNLGTATSWKMAKNTEHILKRTSTIPEDIVACDENDDDLGDGADKAKTDARRHIANI